MRWTIVVASFVVFLGVASDAQAEMWTDVSGKYSIEAEFVKLTGGAVKLRRTNGEVISVPLAKLSTASQRLATQAAAEAAKAPTTPEGASPENDADIQLTATAKWSDTIQIREDNTQAPANLEVVIEARGTDAKEASAFGFVKTRGVTAGGKRLSPAESFGFQDPAKEFFKIDRDQNAFFSGHPKDGVRVTLTFANPGSDVAQVDSLNGSFKLRTGGERKIVTIADLSKAKRGVDDPALKKAGVQVAVKSQDNNSLEVAVSGNTDAIDTMEVTDGNGNTPAGYVGGGTGTINGQMFHQFQFESGIPAGIQLKITLLTGTRDIEVPFEFENLKVEK